jgi:Flp pilus assembly protein TadD
MEIKSMTQHQKEPRAYPTAPRNVFGTLTVCCAALLVAAGLCMAIAYPGLADSPFYLSEAGSRQEGYARSAENSARYQKALRAGAAEDFRSAVRLLREAVAADPSDFEAWAELGVILLRQGKRADAEKACMQAFALQPSSVQVLLALGQIQLARKKNDAAMETLRRAVTEHPQHPQAHYFLGEAFLQSKMGSRAALHMNEALKLDPMGMAEAHLRLASLYRAAGRNDQAAAEYEKYLAKKPDYSERQKLLKFIRSNKK